MAKYLFLEIKVDAVYLQLYLNLYLKLYLQWDGMEMCGVCDGRGGCVLCTVYRIWAREREGRETRETLR